jgi:hypothetical protein
MKNRIIINLVMIKVLKIKETDNGLNIIPQI